MIYLLASDSITTPYDAGALGLMFFIIVAFIKLFGEILKAKISTESERLSTIQENVKTLNEKQDSIRLRFRDVDDKIKESLSSISNSESLISHRIKEVRDALSHQDKKLDSLLQEIRRLGESNESSR